MSSHVVGYALNDVIELFEKEGVWALLGPERSRQLILKMLDVGHANDCGRGDILQDIGPRYGICIACLGQADEYREGFCPKCYAEWYEFTFGKQQSK